MDYWAWILVQLIAVCFLIYFYFQRKFTYWSSRGISGPQPTVLFGNLWDYLRIGQVRLEKEWPLKYGKIYGIYHGIAPLLTITDAELIKQVLIKDFHVFVNRVKLNFDHEIWANNLGIAYDEQWRRIRAITTPSFTTGKLKGMHSVMSRCVDKLVKHFDHVIKTKEGKMNAKEVITGFTVDVIASTSFATETNVNNPGDSTSLFLQNCLKMFAILPLKLISFFFMPKWFNKHVTGVQVGFPDEQFEFFANMAKEIIRQRKAQSTNPKQNKTDLVQLMMDAFVYDRDLKNQSYDKLTTEEDNDQVDSSATTVKEGSIKRTLTENEIIAQCILFFVAGFETTANTIANILYHLAIYPAIQEQLYAELVQTLDGLDQNSDLYFEKISTQIPYLDAVIKETLRMVPPVTRLQRKVGVDGYKLAGIALEKDIVVEVGSYSVHYNPEYYPEPEKFDPPRFMPENKHLLVPYTYLPFGAGPRNCIGMRFAYQEIKLCLAQIVRQFKFSPTPETKIPLEYGKMRILNINDIPMRVESRLVG